MRSFLSVNIFRGKRLWVRPMQQSSELVRTFQWERSCEAIQQLRRPYFTASLHPDLAWRSSLHRFVSSARSRRTLASYFAAAGAAGECIEMTSSIPSPVETISRMRAIEIRTSPQAHLLASDIPALRCSPASSGNEICSAANMVCEATFAHIQFLPIHESGRSDPIRRSQLNDRLSHVQA